MALVTAQAIVVLLFSITFSSRAFTIKKQWIVLIIAIGLVSVVVCFSPFVFSDVIMFKDGSAHLPVAAPGIVLFAIITLGSIISSIVIALKRYRRVTGLVKLQLKYFVYGILLMYAGEVFFSFIMVVVFKNSSFVYLGSLFTLPFIFFTT